MFGVDGLEFGLPFGILRIHSGTVQKELPPDAEESREEAVRLIETGLELADIGRRFDEQERHVRELREKRDEVSAELGRAERKVVEGFRARTELPPPVTEFTVISCAYYLQDAGILELVQALNLPFVRRAFGDRPLIDLSKPLPKKPRAYFLKGMEILLGGITSTRRAANSTKRPSSASEIRREYVRG